MTTTTTTNILTGDALLAKIEEMGDVSKRDIAIACGYIKEDGTPDFTAFYTALLAAKGGIIGDAAPGIDNELYEISVPVYVSVTVYRKPGMSKEDVINSITWDDIADSDEGYLSESVEDALKHNKKEIEVFNENGEEVK